jgi:hypothetical protein
MSHVQEIAMSILGFRRIFRFSTALTLLVLGGSHVPTRAQLNLGAGEKADDAVRRGVLAGDKAPKSIVEIRQRLLKEFKGTLKTHIVANGGHEHPVSRNVMFMAFETYAGPTPGGLVEEGDLFFGYFLEPEGNTVGIGSGFVELIAWDRTKQMFNFWELIGARWLYRGDSGDVLTNIARLNVGDEAPRFNFVKKNSLDGSPVLRCSGCHTLGTPIMKELEAPHNDWWTSKNKLPPGPFQLRQDAAGLFQDATDASNLSFQVKKSINRLVEARAKSQGAGQNVRQQLRSLFVTMEMNLASDTVPFEERARAGQPVEVPRDFFVDARLAGQGQPVPVGMVSYKQALTKVGSRFPASGGVGSETRHAFLVPARSHVDNRVIDSLLKQGVLDEELVADVLAVDMTTPVYSSARASLIRFVPERAANVSELRTQLILGLKSAPKSDRAAQELLANLTDSSRTAEAHRKASAAYLAACVAAASEADTIEGWLRVAGQRRRAIESAQAGAHPEGNVVEKGFREVFPAQNAAPKPLRLNPKTGRAEPVQ